MRFIDESQAWWLEGLARGWLHVWPQAARDARDARECAAASEDSHARARRWAREERKERTCTTAD